MTTQTPIFRTITLDEGMHLTLGEPIPPRVREHMHPIGEDRLQMDAGTFGHAASITATLGAGEAVAIMEFAYADGTSYDDMVAAYTRELGPPARQDDSTRRTLWLDPQTSFEVFSRDSSVGSELRDRAQANA